MSKTFVIFFTVFFSLASCSDEPRPSVHAYNNPINFDQIFDTFWVKMNSNYVYWDIDTTNWDKVYQKYKPLFHQLDFSNQTDIQKSVYYFREMTSGLIDCHYFIEFSTKHLPYGPTINPGFERKQAAPTYRYPYNFQPGVISYLDPGYFYGEDAVSSTNNQTLSTLSGTINKDLLYFSCNAMFLRQAYQSTANKNRKVLDFFLKSLPNSSNSLKGVILDLRYNSGGDLADLNFLVGQFTNSQIQYGFTHYKYDGNRLDFTPWVNAYLNSPEKSVGSTLPLIVLADNFTASSAELITQAVSNLPKAIFIGEKTYGATGPVTVNQIYNDGSFSVGDFLKVQTASAAFRTLDNKNYENIGFDPDVTVPFDASSIIIGKDLQLERAIHLLHQ